MVPGSCSQYLASRTEADKKEFLNLAREGKIGVPAQYVNELTGYATLEELIRSTSYSQAAAPPIRHPL